MPLAKTKRLCTLLNQVGQGRGHCPLTCNGNFSSFVTLAVKIEVSFFVALVDHVKSASLVTSTGREPRALPWETMPIILYRVS